MPNVKKVLFLDGSDLASILGLAALQRDGRISVTTENMIVPGTNTHHPTGIFLRALQEHTTIHDDFDLVILGKNARAGLPKAIAIGARLRSKTVVVSNFGLRPQAQGEYIRMGCLEFMTRDGLSRALAEKLGFKQ